MSDAFVRAAQEAQGAAAAPKQNRRRQAGAPAASNDQLAKLIDQFNSQYAVVNEAGIAVIYELSINPVLNRKILIRITFENLKKFYQNYKITI